MRDDGDEQQGDDREAPLQDRWLHGTWRVARVDGADLADGLQGPPWLTFDGDGQVFGYAGVNRVRGTWRLEGTRLAFGPFVATLMAGPPDATATERAVLGLLEDGGSVTRDGDVVTLQTPGGRVGEIVRSPGEPGDGPRADDGRGVPR